VQTRNSNAYDKCHLRKKEISIFLKTACKRKKIIGINDTGPFWVAKFVKRLTKMTNSDRISRGRDFVKLKRRPNRPISSVSFSFFFSYGGLQRKTGGIVTYEPTGPREPEVWINHLRS